MTEIELELTYLVKSLPANLAACPSTLITDIYYPDDAPHPNLRLRHKGDRYEITKKVMANGNDSSHMIEETIPLSAQEFAALTKAGGKRVSKRRYVYDYEGRVAEIDIFQDGLQGLVLVDFEFATRVDQQNFVMPEFCLADVTQELFIAGAQLPGKTYADIAPDLDRFNYKPTGGAQCLIGLNAIKIVMPTIGFLVLCWPLVLPACWLPLRSP